MKIKENTICKAEKNIKENKMTFQGKILKIEIGQLKNEVCFYIAMEWKKDEGRVLEVFIKDNLQETLSKLISFWLNETIITIEYYEKNIPYFGIEKRINILDTYDRGMTK